MKKRKVELYCLGIELTRRCNMACDFCSKGIPQNVNITKAIIDKTLDELQNAFIYSIRLTGGEPMLAPEMIVYLIKQIIERRILVNHLTLFSNGTVCDEKLLTAFKEMAVYIRSIKPSMKDFAHYEDWYYSLYKGTENSTVDIIISTHHHDNQAVVDDTIEFYSRVPDPDFAIVSQSNTFSNTNTILLEGNAAQNYKTLFNEPVNHNRVRKIIDQFYFISVSVGREPPLRAGRKSPIVVK